MNEPDIIVLNFGVSITNAQLDSLLSHGQVWHHYSVPVQARRRLIQAIRQALNEMADENGRILPDPIAFEDFVNGLH